MMQIFKVGNLTCGVMHPFKEELCGLHGLQLCQGSIQRPLPARPGVDMGWMARGLAFGSGSVEAMML